MKKTLVALAVMAASGASFAQVTITGQYGFGYAQSSDSANATAGGLGISDSNISFVEISAPAGFAIIFPDANRSKASSNGDFIEYATWVCSVG